MSKKALNVAAKDGVITISIGIDTLIHATRHGLDPRGLGDFKVTDKSAFIKSVVSELNDEQEDGTTLVHKMLDNAVAAAIESGADGIDL